MNLRRYRGWAQAVILAVLVYGVLVIGAERQSDQYHALRNQLVQQREQARRQQAETVCILRIPPEQRTDPLMRHCLSDPAAYLTKGGP